MLTSLGEGSCLAYGALVPVVFCPGGLALVALTFVVRVARVSAVVYSGHALTSTPGDPVFGLYRTSNTFRYVQEL